MNSPPLMLASTAMLTTCQTLWLLISQAIIFTLGVLVALEGLLLLLQAFKLIALFKQIQDYDQHAAFRGQKLPGSQDPKMTSTLTIEVPCCYAEEWKCKLEEMHSGPKKCKRDEMEQHEPGDAAGGQIISGLKVVASVYDACKDSFVAADEQQEKALKKYFEDTGLMASVCHHGIPLFHVGLWTPGEQQFYAFALLSMLLEHLPNSWKVGCLYDIGCQIHCAFHN